MRYLLDTHAVLWITQDASQLSARVRALAKSNDPAQFGLAAITLLEMARLIKTGVITSTASPADSLEENAGSEMMERG